MHYVDIIESIPNKICETYKYKFVMLIKLFLTCKNAFGSCSLKLALKYQLMISFNRTFIECISIFTLL